MENSSYSDLNITVVRPSPQSVVLNDYSLSTGTLHKNRELIKNPTFWHKFFVYNVFDFDRDFILKTLMDHVLPHDLIPVYYVKEKNNAFFLARNCESAIDKLCRDNLTVDNPLNKGKPFKITIIIRFSTTNEIKIDISKNITKVIKKRLSLGSLTLDLFYQDPDLTEFCVLSQPKLLSYVLHLSKTFKPKSLILSNNEIRTLVPIEALWGTFVNYIDLRNNNLANLSELEPLNQLRITDIWLEGNPLCDNYDEHTYIQRIRDYCPHVERVDGILLRQKGFPSLRRNFLCNKDGHDLVDQFLEYYFTSFDSKNRAMLRNLYHKSCMFSLTAEYIAGQMSSGTAQIKRYKTHSRNLLALADLSRTDMNLQQGSKAVIDFLCALPATEHDPYSFTVDLIHYSDTCAIIVVTGVYRELPETILDVERMLGFNRLFVLEAINGEYCIINEQLHVFNALSSQQVKAFKHDKPIRPQLLPPAQTPKQKNDMINAFKQITNLITEWAKKCLDECHYDLKNAITLFVDLYKVDKIPADGFQT